ncbi:hypothetical protein QFZ40_000764 [Arthrobacter pascens]|uniref:hypothetical protein n=1 Tax=Arthrobacter pascens TaxID=1677 RepID=UPI0027843385|nr:hypothetical protein [Arthrobacter pascens]MDQ0632855.1 hypothetical protein [Arthrobacter pascens]
MNAPFRFPRAAAVAAAIFGLAAGAHMLSGGSLPGPEISFGLLALVLAPVMILTKIRITAPVMILLLGSSQLILHGAFDALSVDALSVHGMPVHALSGPAGLTPSSGHLHGVSLLSPAPLTAPLEAAQTAASGALMLILHAAATVITALVLARGEAALWALAAWLRPLIQLLAALFVPAWPRLPLPAPVVIPSRWRTLRLPALRGPPRSRAAL